MRFLQMWVGAEDMVNATLAGFYQNEPFGLPSLSNPSEWAAWVNARLALGPNLSLQHAVARYKTTGASCAGELEEQ